MWSPPCSLRLFLTGCLLCRLLERDTPGKQRPGVFSVQCGVRTLFLRAPSTAEAQVRCTLRQLPGMSFPARMPLKPGQHVIPDFLHSQLAASIMPSLDVPESANCRSGSSASPRHGCTVAALPGAAVSRALEPRSSCSISHPAVHRQTCAMLQGSRGRRWRLWDSRDLITMLSPGGRHTCQCVAAVCSSRLIKPCFKMQCCKHQHTCYLICGRLD